MSIAVIGAGKWGQALQGVFLEKTDGAMISSRTRKELPFFVDLETALKADLLVVSISVQATANWLKNHFRLDDQLVLVCSKGIDTQCGKFLNEIYEDFVPRENLAYLSGPGFAAEVRLKLPTALTIASSCDQTAAAFMALFPSYIKTYRTNDVYGAEIAGAYKNVIAIAAGVGDALGLGNNARAALITRGLAEMTRFGMSYGARLETFLGLAGVGDLALTATSELSRNYRVGQALGRKEPLERVLNNLGEVAEGVPTARAIMQLSTANNLHTPIAAEVCKLFDGKDPRLCLKSLLERTKEEEF